MGKLIIPLKNFIMKYINETNNLIFITCCGSILKKNEKFGHNLVFNEVKKITRGKCIHCEAFPITLVLPDEQKEDPDATTQKTLLAMKI